MVVASCDKNDDDNNNGTGGSMSARVDGTSWTASLAVAAANTNGVLSVTGSGSDGTQCNITLYNIPGTGTYTVGGDPSNANTGRWTGSINAVDTYTTMVGQGTGTVEITELTASKVSGSFSFTAKNTLQNQVSVTQGTFSANL